MTASSLIVTFEVPEAGRAAIAQALAGVAVAVYLGDMPVSARAPALRNAAALIVRNPVKEFREREIELIGGARLVQFITAGVDHLPLSAFPAHVPLAGNGGGYAEPMAEHALALTLAAAKRLLVEHRNLARGEFNQFVPNRMLAGRVCGIFGFGGIGTATARLMRCLGLRIHAINRRGASEHPVDWIGSPDRLEDLLRASDVLVISAPLTRRTERLVGSRELSWMKDDAILVNVARGEIVDEVALYEHLCAHPGFTACLDAWWVEPIRHGAFRMGCPFLELPNVIGSPHNSASVGASVEAALRCAAENCRRALTGERPLHLLGQEERMR